jgi:hypothetical protein
MHARLPASLLSKASIHQGNVLRVLFFSIGAAHILDTLTDLPNVRLWAYLDDILVAVLQGVTDKGTKAAVALTFTTAECEGGLASLHLNWAKSVVWAQDTRAHVPTSNNNSNSKNDVGWATVVKGLKILGMPIGACNYVARTLRDIVTCATSMLDLVADTSILLQHKLVLLQQCVTQIPMFYAQAVPGARPVLAIWGSTHLLHGGPCG